MMQLVYVDSAPEDMAHAPNKEEKKFKDNWRQKSPARSDRTMARSQ